MSTPVRVFLTGSIFCGVREHLWADLFPGSIFCGVGENLWADLFPGSIFCGVWGTQVGRFVPQMAAMLPYGSAAGNLHGAVNSVQRR